MNAIFSNHIFMHIFKRKKRRRWEQKSAKYLEVSATATGKMKRK